jgi:dTDP-4-dehydrorhamnose 3,5-epimerase
LESFHQHKFEEATGLKNTFIQDNHSKSAYGVLRGLHFQKPPYTQAKLVRVTQGEVIDVVVDLRQGSPTYGRSFSIVLSAENKKQLFVPRGFAHGFAVLSETAEFLYKCDNIYAPSHDSGVIYHDTSLAIDWQIAQDQILVSAKDQALPTLAEVLAQNYFVYEQ